MSIEERTVAESLVVPGDVWIPTRMLKQLGIQQGDTVRVEHEAKSKLLRAVVGPAPWAESNPNDLSGIGARSGTTLRYTLYSATQ